MIFSRAHKIAVPLRSPLKKTTLALIVFLLIFPLWTVQAGEWLKGDLHSHSIYSDGDSSVADVIASAEMKGLDFFVLTDHDTYMGGVPFHWFDADYVSDAMVLLYGGEWTTGRGHANVWASRPFLYESLWEANQDNDPQEAVYAAHNQDALFSINHPSHPFVVEWQCPLVNDVDCIEVWNGPTVISQSYRAAHKF
jgi:hypothetical protein